jgi:uncharacterized membrane protein
MPAFVFGSMLIIMGVLRVAMKREEFGFPDMVFVVLFALAMGVVAYLRPRWFR